MTDPDAHPAYFEFVVGEERRLPDLVSQEEAVPLLNLAILAGATEAVVVDASETPLWREAALAGGAPEARHVLRIEGEPAGCVVVRGCPAAGPIAEALGAAIQAVATGNLKRVLTTETHTAVVNRSYDELLETNRKLAASERKYRELSESLEAKVAERTAGLERAWARLLQQEKLASVGQLAAGVAHEINNPMSFVASNINTLSRYVDKFASLLAFQRDAIERSAPEDVRREARQRWNAGRLDFLLGDIDAIFKQSIEGAERVKKIVSDLRGYSHIDDDGTQPADLNAEIDRTLSVLAHEIPPDARIERDFGVLPLFRCNAAHFCQLFLGILLNALQARPSGLVLAIRSRNEGGSITIRISDNGPGIPPEVLPRIFDPFFTTREIGKGMGMGLSVAHDVVTAHGGTIEAGNAPEGGAVFTITLDAGKG
jgi:signal transduction histidine kinase